MYICAAITSHLAATASVGASADDTTQATQRDFVDVATARLAAASNTQKEMLALTKELCVYFACKSGCEHSRVLGALRDFKPMLQAGIKSAQVSSAPEQSPAKNTRSRAKTSVGSRKALGEWSSNNAMAIPGNGIGMEGLGAAVAARAASRRSALAGLP
jgi:hypothetical protein